MNLRVKLDIKKCAKINVSQEAISFWDRGNGNKIFENIFLKYCNLLNIGDSFEFEDYNSERDILRDFNTFIFKITDKKIRVLGNGEDFLEFKLEPVLDFFGVS